MTVKDRSRREELEVSGVVSPAAKKGLLVAILGLVILVVGFGSCWAVLIGLNALY